MEAKKLHQVNINASVFAPFSLSWSEDDRIAVPTKEGILILELIADPDNERVKPTFKHSVISMAQDRNPAKCAGIYSDDIVSRVQRIDAYKLLLDSALAPGLTGTQAITPQVTNHSWSPIGCLTFGRCALAVVTSIGQATLLGQCENEWPITCDLTALWAQQCRPGWTAVQVDSSAHTRLTELEQRVNQLKTTVVAWCSALDAGFARLLMVQASSELVVCHVRRDGSATVEQSFLTGFDHVSSAVFTSDGRIYAGDLQGRVKQFQITDDGIVPLRDVYSEVDLLAVSSIMVLPRSVVFIKQCFVIAVSLESSQVAVHLVDTFAIAGISRVSDTSFVVATQCGKLHALDISDEHVITSHQVATDELALAGVCGLACANSRVFWAALTGHVEMQDAVLHLFHVQPLAVDVHSYHHLELIRLNLMHKKADSTDLVDDLEVPDEPTQLDSLTMQEMRMWRWLTRVKLAVSKKTNGKEELTQSKPSLLELLSQLESRIAVLNACTRLNLCSEASSSASRSFLEQTVRDGGLGDGPALVRVQEVLKSVAHMRPHEEFCKLCGTQSWFEGWQSSTCERHHKLPRCMISLRQVLQVPYFKCFRCHLVALPGDNNDELRCIFCDAYLMPVYR